MGADRLAVEVVGDGEQVRKALAAVPGIAAVEPRRAADGRAAFWLAHSFDDQGATARVADALQRGGWPVEHFGHDRFTLEDVFVSLIRENRASAAVGASSGQGGAA
jgi:hypothetical protein